MGVPLNVNREKFLKTLKVASVGVTKKENTEGSSSFHFKGGRLVTFNGEVLASCKSPLGDIEGIIPSQDFLAILAKFPDEEIDITTKGSELRIKGNKRTAGITLETNKTLPYEEVPVPKKDSWTDLPEMLMGSIYQAALVCGSDETKPVTMVVHVTSDHVEASDNYRLIRTTGKTWGSNLEALIPATSILTVGGVVFSKYTSTAPKKGVVQWLHLATKGGHRVAIRCAVDDYPKLDEHLKLTDATKVVLPSNLEDVVKRAEVMVDAPDALLSVSIEAGEVTLKTRKEQGWYSEKVKVKYDGTPLKFQCRPKNLVEMLTKTRKVMASPSKLKIATGDTEFVVALEAAQ